MALSTSAARHLHLACSKCRFIATIGTYHHHHHHAADIPPQRRTFAASTRRWRPLQGEEHALNDINAAYSPENTYRRSEYVEKRNLERHAAHQARMKDTDDDIEVTGEQLQEMQELEEAIAEEKAQAIAQRKRDAAAAAPEEPPPPPTASNQAEQHLPWYLQLQSPLNPTESTLLSSRRQKMPDIPSHSPDLLEPLFKQVSIDLGMDDLSLLDLRELDPPPALGANLLMIIGTARSEKHLHVSADRLCRWLRSEYKLTPVADGLLGRQELKVKLRRRAKRARLMSAVGGKSHETELEEGIRTGWVCVNVGRVEGGELSMSEAEEEMESKKIVGFGTRTRACHVVVQLMTEEKRGEIDLETLWTGMLHRSRKAKQELMQSEREEEVKIAAAESVPFSPAFSNGPAQQDARA